MFINSLWAFLLVAACPLVLSGSLFSAENESWVELFDGTTLDGTTLDGTTLDGTTLDGWQKIGSEKSKRLPHRAGISISRFR